MRYLVILTLLQSALLPSLAQDNIPDNPQDISPLLIGEIIPDHYVQNIDGNETSLRGLLTEKPSVLIFYRGGWCPYCNIHLSQLKEIEKEVLEFGYQILAISPDTPQNIKEYTAQNKLNYKLFSDPSLELAGAMGIAFRAPEKYAPMLKEKSGGENPGFLPVPAVFVVDRNAKILFEYINPDYSTRISGEMLLAVLQTIKM